MRYLANRTVLTRAMMEPGSKIRQVADLGAKDSELHYRNGRTLDRGSRVARAQRRKQREY